MSFWFPGRWRFKNKIERIWIRYFEYDGKPVMDLEMVDPAIASIVTSIERPVILSRTINNVPEDAINDAAYLIDLFELKSPMEEAGVALVFAVADDETILAGRSRGADTVLKIAMRFLLQFFFQFSKVPKCLTECGFSERFAVFVAVALRLPRKFGEDIGAILQMFLSEVIPAEGNLQVESTLREFRLETFKVCLGYLKRVHSNTELTTNIFTFGMRYIKVAAVSMSQVVITKREYETFVVAMRILAVAMTNMGRREFSEYAAEFVDTILIFHGASVSSVAMVSDRQCIYTLGMNGIDVIMALCKPALPHHVVLKGDPRAAHILTFAVWCLDRLGFKDIPQAQAEFTDRMVTTEVKNVFKFVECDIPFDLEEENWRFKKLEFENMNPNISEMMTKVGEVFRMIGNWDVYPDFVNFFCGKQENGMGFLNESLVPFYAVFVLSHMMLNTQSVSTSRIFLDVFFNPYFFDIDTKVDADHYHQRAFFRNFVFQVLAASFESDANGIFGLILPLFSAPLCVAVELVTFLSELLDRYEERFVAILTLGPIFNLDRALEEVGTRGREVIFVFLGKLIRFSDGINLLLCRRSYIRRLIECSFDCRLRNIVMELLVESLKMGKNIAYFIRFFEQTRKLIRQAIEEMNLNWVKYLNAFLPFLNTISYHFRELCCSSDDLLEGLILSLSDLMAVMASEAQSESLVLILRIFRTLVIGDSGYRGACMRIYESSLFVKEVFPSVVEEILAFVYGSGCETRTCIRNPEALGLAHVSLMAAPEIHGKVFTRIFQDVKRSMPNQLTVVNSPFAAAMLKFMNDYPEHPSYGVFADAVAHLLTNFFDMSFFSTILDFGLSKNWESVILKSSTITEQDKFARSFVYLTTSEMELTLQCCTGYIQSISFAFMLTTLPEEEGATGRLVSIGDDNNTCHLIVGQNGRMMTVVYDQVNNKKVDVDMGLTIQPNVDYECFVSVVARRLTLDIPGVGGTKVRLDFSTRFGWKNVIMGNSVTKKNTPLSMAIYNISVTGHNAEIFSSDFSHIMDDYVVNSIDMGEFVQARVTGVKNPGRKSAAGCLLYNGGLLDLVDRATVSHTLEFIIELLINLIRNEMEFEERFFASVAETDFLHFGAIIDKSVITKEFVTWLQCMTRSVRNEKNQFSIIEHWWFDFEVWRDSAVADYVWDIVLPEIMKMYPKFVRDHLSFGSFVGWGCEGRSFWRATCCYLVQTQKPSDFVELLGLVNTSLPIYFFMNLFGVCSRDSDASLVLQKLSAGDLGYYYETFFFLMMEKDDENVVTEDVFRGIAKDFLLGKTMPIMFDLLMLISQYVPATCLMGFLRELCDSTNDELVQQALGSELLSLWTTFVIMRQSDEVFDLANCADVVIDFIVMIALRTPTRFTEFVQFFRIISDKLNSDGVVVLKQVFIHLCERLQGNITQDRMQVVILVCEYLLFVPVIERYTNNMRLVKAMGGAETPAPPSSISPVLLFPIVMASKHNLNIVGFQLFVKCRVSETGEWVDKDVAWAFLRAVSDKVARECTIPFAGSHEIGLDNLAAYVMQLLLISNSANLEEVGEHLTSIYGESWETMNDLSVRLVAFGAMKRVIREHETEENFDKFIDHFREHIINDRVILPLRDSVEPMFKCIIGSSFAESNFLWMKLLTNLSIMSCAVQGDCRRNIYTRFPFSTLSPEIRRLRPPVLLARWCGIFMITNLSQSRRHKVDENFTIVDSNFCPVTNGGTRIKFTQIVSARPYTSQNEAVFPVTIHSYGEKFESFLFCNTDGFVVAGMTVTKNNVRWVIRHSPSRVEIFTHCGNMIFVEFRESRSNDLFYDYVDQSRCITWDNLSNMQLITRLNITHGHSYNTGTMLLPSPVRDGLSTASTIGLGWHFVRQIADGKDMSEWINERFGECNVKGLLHNVEGIETIGTSKSLEGISHIRACNGKVMTLAAEHGSSTVSCVVSNLNPDFTQIERFQLKFALCAQTKFIFWDDLIFVLYSPTKKSILIYEKPSVGEAKVIGVINTARGLKDIKKVDTRRLVSVLADDSVLLIVRLPQKIVERHIYVKQHTITAFAVNRDLNILATVDASGKVVFTSLSTLFFVKMLNVALPRIEKMVLLNSSAFVVQSDKCVYLFWMDGTRHGRIGAGGPGQQILGYVKNPVERLALTEGDKTLRLIDPFSSFPTKSSMMMNPITTFDYDDTVGVCIAHDGKTLTQIAMK